MRIVDVIHGLNLKGDWSFFIEQFEFFESLAVVKVKLRLYPRDKVVVEKEAFGSCSLDFVDGDVGNCLKVASSDGLKRAAALFGIGLDSDSDDNKISQEVNEVVSYEKTLKSEISSDIKNGIEEDEDYEDVIKDNKDSDNKFPDVSASAVDMISDIQKKAIINSQKAHGGNIEDYIFECLNIQKTMDELTYDEAVKVIRYMSEASKKKE